MKYDPERKERFDNEMMSDWNRLKPNTGWENKQKI
jgi:hypothetical protein